MAYFQKRSGSWRAIVKRKGFDRITRTFDTKASAEAWARQIEAEMDRGVFVSRKEAESTTLSEALDRYEREVSSSKKGHRREKTRISIWKNHPLAKRVLASFRGNDLAAYRDERIKAGYSANTIRLELAIISHLFEIARKEWGMEGLTNPVKAIRMPSPPAGRDRRLQPGELEKLLESSSEEMNQVIRFALETAMRRGELAGMTWEMVDMKKRTVTLPETKNGQKRIVPLSFVALSILKERLGTRRLDGKVWDIGLDAISQDFAKACRNAGISGLHFHDLRHEATSRLFEKGFDTMEVRTITGHKTLQMLARYTHLRAEDLVERMK
ncbi:MAG: putative phage integrase [Leptospirillum rubarum]|jgi:integrase|uniref:Putative phage integrase n=2 Tax=Leptospirillum sp. Group II TaxID=261385 RepID=B6AKV3_9BACT|nr:MAG: putative phage integrase [Leptospirillum rubarum]EDZ40215.1 MAG: Putative phage integrase [Leptospirillum sp. Group II '5-way CG']